MTISSQRLANQPPAGCAGPTEAPFAGFLKQAGADVGSRGTRHAHEDCAATDIDQKLRGAVDAAKG